MEASLSLTTLAILVLVAMYFNRAVKATANSLETGIVLADDVVGHTSNKTYGRMSKEAVKLTGKNQYATRKRFKSTLKGLNSKEVAE